LLPGPSSTELAIFIGYTQRGWPGFLVAGCCFIIPAALLVSSIAAAYVRFGALPQADAILQAIKPVVIAIIVQALWNLRKPAAKNENLNADWNRIRCGQSCWRKSPSDAGLGGASNGMVQWLSQRGTGPVALCSVGVWKMLPSVGWIAAAVSLAAPLVFERLFLSFLKIGSVVFGSGLCSAGVPQGGVCRHLQLVNGKAAHRLRCRGSIHTGTGVHYGDVHRLLVGRLLRSICSHARQFFIPGFVFVAVSGPLIPKIRRSPLAGAVLDGVGAASLALIAVVAWQLGRSSITDWFTTSILLISLIAMFRFKLNSAGSSWCGGRRVDCEGLTRMPYARRRFGVISRLLINRNK